MQKLLWLQYSCSIQNDLVSSYCCKLLSLSIVPVGNRFEKRGHFAQNAIFCHFSTYHYFKAVRALGFRLVSSLGLLLHRSNVRSLSKPPVPSSEPPKWGIKRRFSNAIDAGVCPAHTGSGRGPRFAASVVGWWKNIHARFEVHSCYGSRDIIVLKQNFRKCANL